MSKCKPFKDQIYLYCAGLLDKSEKDRFEQHIIECQSCANEVKEQSKILDTIEHRADVANEKVFWAEFDKGLDAKLNKKTILEDISDLITNIAKVILSPQLATAFVLVVAGTFVFKNMQHLEKKNAKIAYVTDGELSIEDEIYIQELMLLAELGEEIELPTSDEELQKDFQMISELNS